MSKYQALFLSVFSGGAITAGMLMERQYSYQNVPLSIFIGLSLAVILIQGTFRE